jgi:hypothetical protein
MLLHCWKVWRETSFKFYQSNPRFEPICWANRLDFPPSESNKNHFCHLELMHEQESDPLFVEHLWYLQSIL